MDIKLEQVRDALRKDDHDYINREIERLMIAAKASVYTSTGFDKRKHFIPPENKERFESLSNSFIIEYVRAYLDQVDNSKIQNTIAVQLEGLFKPFWTAS